MRVPIQIQKCFFCSPSNPNKFQILSKSRFNKTKKKLFSAKNVLKQTKIPDFSDVIYARSKKLLKMMWLSRSPKALDYFSPQKWKVKACSMWSGYLVFGFNDIRPLLVWQAWMVSPPYKAKEILIACNCTHP